MSSELKAGHFIIGGKTSEQLKTVIQHRPIEKKPTRKTNLIPVPGRSGDVVVDENSYENGMVEFVGFVRSNSKSEKKINKEALSFAFDTGTYQKFVPYWDDDYEYEAIVVDGPSFQGNRNYGQAEPYTVALSYKPFKLLRNVPRVQVTSGGTLNNPLKYNSLPYVKITGSGDVTLKVNGDSFVLKNIVGFIELDSEIQECFKLNAGVLTNENSKMFSLDFPVFKPGNNAITWTGNATKVEVEPRWRTI